MFERRINAYLKAFRLTRGYWTGINAAATAVISGDKRTGRSLAAEVRNLCFKELKSLQEHAAMPTG